MQSRWQSFAEVSANYVVAFAVAWVANYFILPLYGFPITPDKTTSLTLIFTVISVVRSFVVRRIFNRLHR